MKISIQSLDIKIIIEREWCKQYIYPFVNKTNEILNLPALKYRIIPLAWEILEYFHLRENEQKGRKYRSRNKWIEIYLLVVEREKKKNRGSKEGRNNWIERWKLSFVVYPKRAKRGVSGQCQWTWASIELGMRTSAHPTRTARSIEMPRHFSSFRNGARIDQLAGTRFAFSFDTKVEEIGR